MSFNDGCLRDCNFFGEFPDLFEYFDYFEATAQDNGDSEALRIAENDNNGSIYKKLQLMANSAVIGVLLRWFYDYLLILGIFPFVGGVCI